MSDSEKTAVVVLDGALNLFDKERIQTLLPNPQKTERVIINMSQVEAIDSSVIAVLMAYRARFRAAGRDPFNIVLMVTPNVQRVLDMTGASRVFTILPAKEDTPNSSG